MDWTRYLGAFVVLVIAVSAVGALATIGDNGLLTGSYTAPAVLTALLVVASVASAIGLGVRSNDFLANPYW